MEIAYADLYSLADNIECSVADCWIDDDWYVDFKRSLSTLEYERWLNLKAELSKVSLSDRLDSISWAFEHLQQSRSNKTIIGEIA